LFETFFLHVGQVSTEWHANYFQYKEWIVSIGIFCSGFYFILFGFFCLGVYLKPSEEQNRKFDERVKWLENVMTPRRELYEAEEKTLRVMLAEEEEEKEKERREMERRNQASLGLSDPMDWFHSYYKQAEHSVQSLMQIRRQWDAFLVPETFPGASRIPDGYVTPAEPSSSLWVTALIDKG